MNSNNQIVHFPGATEHASQVLLDLLVIGRGLNHMVSERFHTLASFLPADFRCQASNLEEIFLIVAAHVESDGFDDLGHVAGENTRRLFEDVAIAVIRRATGCVRNINRMFEAGHGPTVVKASMDWGRFSKDLLTVVQILRCTNRPKRDGKGQVVRDAKGQVVKLKGLFIPPYAFLDRRASQSEVEKGIAPPIGYLDGIVVINEQMGGLDELIPVIATIKAITRSARA